MILNKLAKKMQAIIRKISYIFESHRITKIGPYSKKELTDIFLKLDFYSKEELIKWLRFKAGSENPLNFICRSQGGLELQQIPEEYAEYLHLLKKLDVKNYLQIGAGSGGTFFIDNIFIKKTVNYSCVVDNTSYNNFGNQKEKIDSVISLLRSLKQNSKFDFINTDSSKFFKNNKENFDLIFIDGDHSYEGVKNDYNEARKILKKDGYIILHDINSVWCPGVIKLWNEIQSPNKKTIIHTDKCGIGIIKF